MKKKKKLQAFDICNVVFMLFVLFITIYPLYFTVIASFSDPAKVAGGGGGLETGRIYPGFL